MKLLASFIFMLSCAFSFNAFAAIDEYEFSSDTEQARFKKLTDEMRCPKCLNANLSGSDAPIAADLRAEIYDQIKAGQSNDEIIGFMKERYGDFILYRPPLNANTFLLWFGPGILLIAGFVFIRRTLSREVAGEALEAATQLSADEEEELASILNADGSQSTNHKQGDK